MIFTKLYENMDTFIYAFSGFQGRTCHQFWLFIHHGMEKVEGSLLWRTFRNLITGKLAKCVTNITGLYWISVQIVHKVSCFWKSILAFCTPIFVLSHGFEIIYTWATLKFMDIIKPTAFFLTLTPNCTIDRGRQRNGWLSQAAKSLGRARAIEASAFHDYREGPEADFEWRKAVGRSTGEDNASCQHQHKKLRAVIVQGIGSVQTRSGFVETSLFYRGRK